MKNKTNQVSLRKEIKNILKRSEIINEGRYDYCVDEICKLLTQILEGLPCEEKNVKKEGSMKEARKRPIMGMAPASGYNQHVKEIKQYRDKVLKEIGGVKNE